MSAFNSYFANSSPHLTGFYFLKACLLSLCLKLPDFLAEKLYFVMLWLPEHSSDETQAAKNFMLFTTGSHIVRLIGLITTK